MKAKRGERMAIMKRDVNFVLFILIIVTLVAFAGFSTYYQKTFRNVSTQYQQKISELDEVAGSLQVAQENLSKTSRELRVKGEREEDLSKRYTTLSDLKEQLEKSLTETRSQLAQTTSELETTKSELTTTKSELSTTKSQLDAANAKIDSLKNEIAALKSSISSLNSCISSKGVTC